MHHPNQMGPTDDHLFGLVLDQCFYDSNTQNFGCGWWKMKTGFWCFQFLRIEFQWHFCKIKQRMGPPVWLVPSHNVSLVSLQKSIWHSHSNPFFSLSLLLLLFLLPRALSSHWPFIARPQATTTTPVVTIMSNHQIGPLFFSLSFLPLPDRFLSQVFFFSLSLILFAKSSPSWATNISLREINSSLTQIGSSLCLISWFGYLIYGFWVWVCYVCGLGLLCILLDFLCGIREREREHDQTFMLERRTRDSRNDVELSPSGIVRYVDLEIESFTGNISLYFAFAAVATAKAANAIVSLFRVESSGGAATSAELLVLLLLVLIVVVNNRNSIFWLRFFFALRCCCCSSSSSSAIWDLVMGFLCIILDFLCGCWWCWW